MTKDWLCFETAEACADSAAELFARVGWTWYLTGVPSRDVILRELLRHESYGGYSESGRLAYCDGKFCHQNYCGRFQVERVNE